MTKVLNLDQLETTIDKVVTIKGVDHRMTPLSVEDFINQMKEIDQATSSDMTALEMYELSLKVILRAFPTIPETQLRALNTFQIDSLYAFLKEKVDHAAEEGAEATSGNETGKASS
jgi:hypothetical protein